MEATQGALFRLERWSEYWCLPLNPSKCEASFFSVDSHQAHLSSTSSHSTPTSVSIPLQLFWGSPSTALFPFLNMFLPTFQGLTLYLCFFMRPRQRVPLSSVKSFSSAPYHLCFTRMVSFSKRHQYHQIRTPSPGGLSRLLRVLLVLLYPTSLRGFSTSPTSHHDSLRSFIL